MGILRYEHNGRVALGVREGEEVIDLAQAAPKLPNDASDLLRGGADALAAVTSAAKASKTRLPLANVKILPPAMSAGKIICLGLNYVDHAAEGGRTPPGYPMIFFRAATSFVGHNSPIIRPNCSDQLDYEAELVVFIGKKTRHVSREEALSSVAGYSVFNDGSIRDYQRKTTQWTVGKNFDGTGGFGPEFIAADKLPPGASGLKIQSRLNGQVMQDANTRDMVFGVAETIHLMSECMTLEPGDLLVMGTPGGVGVARKPPVFMKPGDICEIEIEAIGLLRNPIEQESVSQAVGSSLQQKTRVAV
jgi:2-keto-4-pentenoate hydratase/2-oxohepta-3-ene-1,7-dioic acid hydratase in catechol pathway